MTAAPEFSRPVRLDILGSAPYSLAIEADTAERAAIATRFGLRAIQALTAQVTLTRIGEVVTAEGQLRAAVVQACVATDANVPARIDEPFALRFVPESAARADDIELDENALDEIGYMGGSVDVGEAAAQTLALALHPFPRAPDADAALRDAGVIGEDEVRPHTALAGLRDLLKG